MNNKPMFEIYYLHSPFQGMGKKRATVCGIYNTTEDVISFGVSVCSEDDTFDRKKGRFTAHNRASNPNPILKITKDKLSKMREVYKTDRVMHLFHKTASSLANKAIKGSGNKRQLSKYDIKGVTL